MQYPRQGTKSPRRLRKQAEREFKNSLAKDRNEGVAELIQKRFDELLPLLKLRWPDSSDDILEAEAMRYSRMNRAERRALR